MVVTVAIAERIWQGKSHVCEGGGKCLLVKNVSLSLSLSHLVDAVLLLYVLCRSLLTWEEKGKGEREERNAAVIPKDLQAMSNKVVAALFVGSGDVVLPKGKEELLLQPSNIDDFAALATLPIPLSSTTRTTD